MLCRKAGRNRSLRRRSIFPCPVVEMWGNQRLGKSREVTLIIPP
jgi:hypothetical protein